MYSYNLLIKKKQSIEICQQIIPIFVGVLKVAFDKYTKHAYRSATISYNQNWKRDLHQNERHFFLLKEFKNYQRSFFLMHRKKAYFN